MALDFNKLSQEARRDLYDGFHDHARFCRECLSVQNKIGKIVPMVQGPAQKRLSEIVKRCQEQHKPVRIVLLKARQIWGTVGTASEFFRGTGFKAGQHTAVIAQDEEAVGNIYQHYKRFQETYKPFGGWFKLPDARVLSDTIEYENGSWIKIRTSRSLTFGRSYTLRRVHFSEFAFYQNPRAVLLAVLNAVPDDPDTMVVIESTANGVGDEFHRICQEAMDPARKSEWQFMFFAWWEHPEYTSHVSDPYQFEQSLTADERDMMRLYNLTLGQLAWRRWAIVNKCGRDVAKFRQEYPACPEEAFQSSGRPRFSLAHIARMPIIRDAVKGNLEEQIYGGTHRIVFVPDDDGIVTIFRKPEQGRSYSIGADSAEGIDVNEGGGTPDPDFSVASVRDRDTGDQVAGLRARIEPAEFGRCLVLLARYYNQAVMVPEANGPGIATIDSVLNNGYPSGHIFHRNQEPDDDPPQRAEKIGWKTTIVTRPQLISWYDDAIKQFAIYIRDPILAQECRTFVIKPNGKAEHQKGCHDDYVIADALSVVGITHMPRPSPPKNEQPPPSVAKYGRPAEDSDRRGTIVRLR